MKILVTGAAGFIGSHLVGALINQGYDVIGIDNINDYYDVELKYGRLAETGIFPSQSTPTAFPENTPLQSTRFPRYRFLKLDLIDRPGLCKLFENEHFDKVCHLAAQAGVRYSLENPYAYIESNIVGFLNLLEVCRKHATGHLIYASSSSVYGLNEKVPYTETDPVDRPVSLYAATKKSDELMAHAYSKLFNIPTTGIRFFTVYGPWGRPDMAPYLFLKAILEGKCIRVFNNGNLARDFTYIDDIITGMVKIVQKQPIGPIPYAIYNIGNSAPVALMDFIRIIEEVSGQKARKEFVPMQPGDVYQTYADTSALEKEFGYQPTTSIETGIRNFYNWYKNYTPKL